MKHKLTEWFPPAVKPARDGVYQTRFFHGCKDFYRNFSHGVWGFWGIDPQDAVERSGPEFISGDQNYEWRGLAKESQS